MNSPLDTFRTVIEAAGLRPSEIIADGALHRCPVDGKRNAKDGAYVLHLDAPASGWWMNYRTSEESTWTAKEERNLSLAERQALQARITADRHARELETAKRHAEARNKTLHVLGNAHDCAAHPYLDAKGTRTCPGLKVDEDGYLLVPVLAPEDGKPMSLQSIAPEGGKRFLTGGRIQGGFFPIKGQEGRLFICEGLATGLSIHASTEETVLCAFCAGNVFAVARYAREKYPDRELVICADDDRDTKGNPGITNATKAARAANAQLVVPAFQEPGSGTDFNDLHQIEGLDVVRRQLAAVPPATPSRIAETSPPAKFEHGGPFTLRPDGVYFLAMDSKGNVEMEKVCSPLHVLARTRNADGQEWGVLLEVEDSENNLHRWAMPMRMLAGNGDTYRSELLSLGLCIAPGLKGKQRLELFISTAKVNNFARCVDRIGWHGNAFVLPNEVMGGPDGELIVPQGLPSENNFRQKGTLKEWQENVGRLCVGNSRLCMAVSAALAASLLYHLGMESGGFHFVGGSSCGKTTTLVVAGSICGGGARGYLKPWRATDNGLEGIAAAHCDALLCLDEMGQAGAKVVNEAAYMLANGQGKSRADRAGQAREVKTWRTVFISTGEVTLADKLAEDGKGRAKAGQTVRVVDVPADAEAGLGIFENIHGAEDAAHFARRLKEGATSCYGAAFRAWLKKLIANHEDLVSKARAIIRQFEATNLPSGADGQVARVAGRFALVAAAGELGIAQGILPWPQGEATKAASRCFKDWLRERGGLGAQEVTAGLEQVRRFFQAHGESRFQLIGDHREENRPIINRAGFRRDEGGQSLFLVFPEVFRKEVCSGFNDKTLCTELQKAGILRTDPGRNTKTVRIPGNKPCKMIVLDSSVIDGNGGDTSNNPVIIEDIQIPEQNGQAVTLVTEGGHSPECSCDVPIRSQQTSRVGNMEIPCHSRAVTAVTAGTSQQCATLTHLPSLTRQVRV